MAKILKKFTDERPSNSPTPLDALNKTLTHVLKISPLKKRKLRSRKSIEAKKQQIGSSALELAVGRSPSQFTNDLSNVDSLIITDVKNKFKTASSYRDKIQLLTVAASAKLNVNQIAEQFDTSKYLAGVAIEQYKSHGIFSMPAPRQGVKISDSVEKLVTDFYLNDEISKMLPGRKDFVTLKSRSGEKEQIQKRLLLFNLRTVHEMFRDKHQDVEIGLSKFANLRPRQVVFAGAPGTLVVCVCMIHANPDLMWESVKYVAASSSSLKTCTDCILTTLCNPSSPDCNLGACTECPGYEQLEATLANILQLHEDSTIKYSQWVIENNRCTFAQVSKAEDEFIADFVANLEKLAPHRFLCKMQHDYFEQVKNTLTPGVVLVLLDYSENFTFIIQNAIQANHWQNDQCTIHVCVCIYRGEDGELKYVNHVVFSDYMKHETMAVHLFLEKLMNILTEVLPWPIIKLIYFSDGAASQYKNRYNLCNLMHHEEDFGCKAEWNFHPTSHGKNLCDGVGGTVKRKAHNASLQKGSTDPITTPKKLFEYVRANMPSIHCSYTDIQEHTRHNRTQQRRFKKCPAIVGCRSLHFFEPKSSHILAAKVFSLSHEEMLFDKY